MLDLIVPGVEGEQDGVHEGQDPCEAGDPRKWLSPPTSWDAAGVINFGDAADSNIPVDDRF